MRAATRRNVNDRDRLDLDVQTSDDQQEDPPLSFALVVTIHAIADEGLPDMDALAGRVAFLHGGNIISGWPLHFDPQDHSTPYSGHWEANTDVGHNRPFSGVTHWIEFPQRLIRLSDRRE